MDVCCRCSTAKHQRHGGLTCCTATNSHWPDLLPVRYVAELSRRVGHDFCQNMAGFTTLGFPRVYRQGYCDATACRVIGRAKPCPIFHHYSNTAELTNYTTGNTFKAIQYTPYFTYMGFRFVELSGPWRRTHL